MKDRGEYIFSSKSIDQHDTLSTLIADKLDEFVSSRTGV